jgi:tricorn protease
MNTSCFDIAFSFSRNEISKCALRNARRRRERCSRVVRNAKKADNGTERTNDDGAFVQQPQVAPSTSSGEENETTIVFVAEDELYSIAVDIGNQNRKIRAHRLTTATGECFSPLVSKCGTFVVFAAIEYYTMELFLVPIEGGAVKQITYMGADFIRPLSFSDDGSELFFVSSSQQRTPDETDVYRLRLEYKNPNSSDLPSAMHPKKLNLGPATAFEVNSDGTSALFGRNTQATRPWRKYGGGASGDVWITKSCGNKSRGENGEEYADFVRVDALDEFFTSISQPKWLNTSTIVFLAESKQGDRGLWSFPVADNKQKKLVHQPTLLVKDANIQSYSMEPSGKCTYASRCGQLYTADLHKKNGSAQHVAFKWTGPRKQLEQRYVTAEHYVQDWDIDPAGRFMATIVRGEVNSFGLWDGPALKYAPIKLRKDEVEENSEDLMGSALCAKIMRESNARARSRFARFTYDAERLVIVSDQTGEDGIEVHWEDNRRMPRRLNIPPQTLGRVEEMVLSPEAPLACVVNHRAELLVIDINTGETQLADKSLEDRGLYQCSWSPCGNWVAYTFRRRDAEVIKILDVRTGATQTVTKPILGDTSPSWDPDGRYLFFLSARELQPQYDTLLQGMSFPHLETVYCLRLRKNVRDPHLKEIRPVGDESYTESFALGDADLDDDKSDDEEEDGEEEKKRKKKNKIEEDSEGDKGIKFKSKEGKNKEVNRVDEDDEDEEDDEDDEEALHDKPPNPVEIDFDGIAERAVALPLPLGRYSDLVAIRHDRFMVVKYPTISSGEVNLTNSEDDLDQERGGSLISFDVRDLSAQVLVSSGVTDVHVSMNKKIMVLEKSEKGYTAELAAYKAGSKPDDEDSDDLLYRTRKSGTISLDRVRVLVRPKDEWTQMLLEIWRRVRDDLFIDPLTRQDFDWKEALRTAVSTLPRINTRAEFAVVVSDMLSELGFSHAHVSIGDDGRAELDRDHQPGFLGANFSEWDDSLGGYKIESIVRGDPWSSQNSGSLYRASTDIQVGDVLGAINRVRLSPEKTPGMLLYETAGHEVLLSVLKKDSGELVATRTRALSQELDPRYRDYIDSRTEYVHKASDDKVGYLHLSDMERLGFSQFWRSYQTESINQRVLIIDFRGNGGGNISALLLQTLTQRALAMDVPRRGSPLIYPPRSPSNVGMVALVDENTGSDAELAAHAFQKLGIGSVVGERTWGGLLAVSRSDVLNDGSVLTMPTQNVRLEDDENEHDNLTNSVENRGVIPDVEVKRAPGNMNEVDAQLDAAIREALRLIEENSSRSSKLFGKTIAAASKHDVASREASPWTFKTFAKFPPTLAEELKEKAKALEKTPEDLVDVNEKNTTDTNEKRKKKVTRTAAKKEKSIEDDADR